MPCSGVAHKGTHLVANVTITAAQSPWAAATITAARVALSSARQQTYFNKSVVTRNARCHSMPDSLGLWTGGV